MADFSLKGTLDLNTRDFVKGADKATSAAEDTTDALEDTGDAAEGVGKEFDKAARKADDVKKALKLDEARDDLQGLRTDAEQAGRAVGDMEDPARRAGDGIETVRSKGEGLQSAVPALRGFTDELGGTAAGAGIASQAVADLGDFSLIMGEKMGLSTAATTGLGTALGGLALAGVVVGGAVAGLQMLSRENENVAKQTEGATEALQAELGVLELLDDALSGATPLVQAILGDEDPKALADIGKALFDIGMSGDEIGTAFSRIEQDAAGFFEEVLAGEGVLDEFANRRLAELIDETDGAALALAEFEQEFPELGATARRELGTTVDALEDLQDAGEDIRIGEVVEDIAAQLFLAGEISAETFDAIVNGALTAEQQLARLELATSTEDYGRSQRLVNEAIEAGLAGVEAYGEEADDAADAVERLHLANLALMEGELGVEAAFFAAQQSLDTLNTTTDDAETLVNEHDVAMNRAIASHLNAAKAAADQEIALAEAGGAALTAGERNEILRGHLENVAGSLAPGSALRNRLAEYIGQLGSIPRRITTRMNVVGGSIPRAQYNSQGFITGWSARDGGFRRGIGLVGEEGPELVNLGSRGGFIHTAPETERILSNAQSVTPTPTARGGTGADVMSGAATVNVYLDGQLVRDAARVEIRSVQNHQMMAR